MTPFRAQANFIRDLVSTRETLLQALVAADYLVDTVHKFQGDERDLILFSPTISNGASSGALTFLKKNGHLFNVAITRARASLTVVGDKVAAEKCGVEYLAEYSKYVSAREQTPKQVTQRTPDLTLEYPKVANANQVSDWERFFYRRMREAGLRPIPQYQEDMYYLDFALIEGEDRLNVEVDGEHYHRRWDGELVRRDQLRNQRLIELGWDVKRFWVYQLRDDIDGCVKRVAEWVKRHAGDAAHGE